MAVSERLEKLFDSYYGIDVFNPKSRYWFIGIEWGGTVCPLEIEPELWNKPSNGICECYYGLPYYRKLKSFISGLFPDQKDINLNDYFIANLYPIAKPGISSWTKCMADFSGFKKLSEYYDYCYNRHLRLKIKDALKTTNNKIVFCFGKDFQWYFIKHFSGDDREFSPIPERETNNYQVFNLNNTYGIKKLVMLKHISGARGLSDEQWKSLGAELQTELNN